MNNFEERFVDLLVLKPENAFLLNSFEIDVMDNGFTLLKCLLSEIVSGELELVECKKVKVYKCYINWQKSINEFCKCYN